MLSFRRSPGVMPAARHILETSSSTDARFHAACALREAMLREWASHAPEERSGLRSYLLSYVLAHAGAPSLGVVNAAIAGALAVSLKRGWMEAPDSRGSLFQVRVKSSQGEHNCTRTEDVPGWWTGAHMITH